MKAKNLVRGASAVLEIWPAPRRSVLGRHQSAVTDAEALRKDAEKVGGDFLTVMDRATNEPKKNSAPR